MLALQKAQNAWKADKPHLNLPQASPQGSTFKK